MYERGRAGLDLPNQKARDAQAVTCYEQAAHAGNSAAQIRWGAMYQRGRAGLDLPNQAARDAQAVTLYKLAARAGNSIAQNNLGFMYAKGRAGLDLPNQEARDTQAIAWYNQAIHNGCTHGHWNLATLYQSKNCTELALKYYTMAAYSYGNRYPNDFEEVINRLSTFPDSPIKSYAQASVQAYRNKDEEAQAKALSLLKKPSQCALFIDQDLIHPDKNGLYLHSLYNIMWSFSEQILILEDTEKQALSIVLLKIIERRLMNANPKVLALQQNIS